MATSAAGALAKAAWGAKATPPMAVARATASTAARGPLWARLSEANDMRTPVQWVAKLRGKRWAAHHLVWASYRWGAAQTWVTSPAAPRSRRDQPPVAGLVNAPQRAAISRPLA